MMPKIEKENDPKRSLNTFITEKASIYFVRITNRHGTENVEFTVEVTQRPVQCWP